MPSGAGFVDSPPFRSSRITSQLLVKAATKIVRFDDAGKLPSGRTKELWLQGFLLGFLEGRVGYMSLEFKVDSGRIDFYHKGNPPTAVEFAVIVGKWKYQHLPRINETEFKKLRGLKHPKRVGRYLLLMDLKSERSLDRKKLEKQYVEYFGRNKSKPVKVIYVHRNAKFGFIC